MEIENPSQYKQKHSKPFIITIYVVGALAVLGLLVVGYISSIKQNNINPQVVINQGELKPVAEQLTEQGAYKTFANYEDARSYIQSQNQGYDYYGYDTRGMVALEAAPMADFGESVDRVTTNQATGLGSAGDGDDFSKTNIQVEGVDEADIIKTDGEYLYIASGQNLYIIKGTPPEEAEIVATIEMESQATNLYIAKNRLAVFGYNHSLIETKKLGDILPHTSYTFFHLYDTSDVQNPKLIRELNFQGNYQNSRMIGDYVYFITNSYPGIYTDIIVPRMVEGNEIACTSDTPDGGRCPFIHYFDIPNPSQQLTTVAAIPITDVDKPVVREVYMLGSSHALYVSTDALYLTNTKYLNEYQLIMEVTRDLVKPTLPATAQSLIAKIEATDSDVLSDNEKISKINTIIQQHILTLPAERQEQLQDEIEKEAKRRFIALAEEFEQTIISKFSLDNDSIEHVATGAVPGSVLNQFSMDEQEDYFRIATTRNRTWSRFLDQQQESSNNLYVLDNDLDIVGRLEGLAEGERIYSVRFMQDRAYMVTFVQVDPLFVIDLADPKNPQVLGELKIPGFSNYLHPYNDEYLIGLGQDTVINEFDRVRNQGVKLSLFDVRDVTNPREVDTYVSSEPNSSSLAQHDHKAFLFSQENNLLVIPIQVWGETRFDGALVFTVTEQGFELKGNIEHKQNVNNNYYDYNSQIKRSLYINDTLYTLSNSQLRLNDLDTLNDIKTINMEYGYPKPIPYGGPEVIEVFTEPADDAPIQGGASAEIGE